MNIIITGTSAGIGFELVKQLITNDRNKIIAISRNILPLEEFAANKLFRCVALDLSQPGHINLITNPLEDFFNGKVDILINNAGNLVNKPFEHLSANDFDQMFNVNVKGVFLLVQKLLPYFNNPSHLVNIGSMGGFQGSPKFAGLSLYSASKGALAILSECMAEEFKPRGIVVNTLALGAVDTPMLHQAFPGYTAPISAAEMAAHIAHFALTGHRLCNGKIIPVALSTP